MRHRHRAVTSVALWAAASSAYAHHAGATGAAFAVGLLHPLSGFDHLLAMLAVGVWAAQMGGKALWRVPATFVLVMLAGGALGMAGVPLPYVEAGIAASLVVLGLLVASAAQLPLIASMSIVGLFALFHGHAHGSEIQLDASPAFYALGFVIATGTLHVIGIMLARPSGLASARSDSAAMASATSSAMSRVAISDFLSNALAPSDIITMQ
jgi:urease accessory protein